MLGLTYLALGRSEEALESLKRAVPLDPKWVKARVGLVRAYVALGKKGLAQQELSVLQGIDQQAAHESADVVEAVK